MGWIARGFQVTALALVGLGIAFVLSRFLPFDGPMRHMDTKWLNAAAACIWEGQSPYNAAFFEACWAHVTDVPYHSTFVFGTPLVPLIAPLGAMDSVAFYRATDVANALAICALAVALWFASEAGQVRGGEQVRRAVWLAFAVSLGGIAGAGYKGQPAIFVALGVVLVYLAIRRKNGFALMGGTFLCLIKPHLCLMPLAIAWFWEPKRLWGAKFGALVLIAGSIGVAAALNGALLADYGESLRLHSESVAAKFISMDRLVGVAGVLDREGVAMGTLLLCVAALGAAAAGALLLSRVGPDLFDGLYVSAVFAGLFLFPIKDYDLATLAIAYAVLARQSLMLQAVFALPMLLMWRPALAEIAGMTADDRLTLTTVVGIGIACGMAGATLGRRLAVRP